MNVEIADRLASRRKDAGYSQEELAMRLGVSRQAVSKWERSESSPDTNNLIALAKLYDVSLDDLLYVDSSIEDDIEFEMHDRAAEWTESDDEAPGIEEETDEEDSGAETCDEAYEFESDDSGFRFVDGSDHIHISWRDGINISENNGTDRVHVGWDGIHVVEGGDDPTNITWQEGEGVYINDEHFESWQEVVDHYDPRKNVWLSFPYPILALLVFFWIGFAYHQWLLGALAFLTVPVYYIVVEAFRKRTVDRVLAALYALGSTIWFFYMGFTEQIWHPTWLVFFTIPLFNWLARALFRRKHKPKKEVTSEA